MLTDIQIAQEAKLAPIKEVAASIGILEDDLELYGKYKAKLSDALMERSKNNPDGKLILVTAINPTPAGEGKTTITVGLGQAFGKIGKKAVIALREPSLGPCFGVKGGAAGGGYAQVVPMEDLNLHFTGDFHAIGAANNLLAAMLDNHIKQGNELGIDPTSIVFKRVMDMNDRALRNITIGLGGKANGVPREDHFMITVASEIMAILCLASDLEDLKKRFGDILDGKRTWQKELARSNVRPTLPDAVAGDITAAMPYRAMTNIINFIQAMDEVVPGFASYETLLYSPELKFYSNRVKMDEKFNTNISGLHCLGDSSGWTRGLMMASVMGVIMGRKIVEKEQA